MQRDRGHGGTEMGGVEASVKEKGFHLRRMALIADLKSGWRKSGLFGWGCEQRPWGRKPTLTAILKEINQKHQCL